MAADLPAPDYARNMRLHRPFRPGRPAGRRADHGATRPRLHRPHVLQGLQRHRRARPARPEAGRLHRRRRPTPGTSTCRPTATCCWSINAKDMFAAAEFADERAYYKGQVGKAVGTAEPGRRAARDWTAGLAVYDISKPAAPRRIGFMPVEGGGIHRIWYTGGRWAYVSALLDGFTDYIFMTVDMADPTQPARGRALLAARHEPGRRRARRAGRRPAATACTTPSSTATPPTAPGATRGLVMIDVADRSKPEAHHASQLVAALRRRHPQLPAAARPRSAGGARRGGARPSGGRPQADLAVRHPRAGQPGQHLHLPDAGRGRLRAPRAAHFGPHNIHENRPGSFVSSELIFATYQNAGVRVLRHPRRLPAQGGRRPGAAGAGSASSTTGPTAPSVVQSTDVFVDRNGMVYCTDYNAGLYIMEYVGR